MTLLVDLLVDVAREMGLSEDEWAVRVDLTDKLHHRVTITALRPGVSHCVLGQWDQVHWWWKVLEGKVFDEMVPFMEFADFAMEHWDDFLGGVFEGVETNEQYIEHCKLAQFSLTKSATKQ